MYRAAACNRRFTPEIHIRSGEADIRFEASGENVHAGGTVHGMIYFKALDDAAYFAAQSEVTDVMLLTAGFSIQFIRPLNSGPVRALGYVSGPSMQVLHAHAELYDARQRLVGRGQGTYARSRTSLEASIGYRL